MQGINRDVGYNFTIKINNILKNKLSTKLKCALLLLITIFQKCNIIILNLYNLLSKNKNQILFIQSNGIVMKI